MSHSNSTELEDIRVDAELVAKILLDECDVSYEDPGITTIKIDQSLPNPGLSMPFGSIQTEVTIEVVMMPNVNLRAIEAANTIQFRDNIHLSGVRWHSTEIILTPRDVDRAMIKFTARELHITGPLEEIWI